MINSNTEIQKDIESPAKKKHNAKVEVDGELCKECLLCIEACAPDVLKVADALNKMGYHPVEYIGEGCTGCGVCFYVCPEPGTIKVYKKIKAA
jgi:NAD-dependent dihydropyrimidine dehydrogenase PreA subunit